MTYFWSCLTTNRKKVNWQHLRNKVVSATEDENVFQEGWSEVERCCLISPPNRKRNSQTQLRNAFCCHSLLFPNRRLAGNTFRPFQTKIRKFALLQTAIQIYSALPRERHEGGAASLLLNGDKYLEFIWKLSCVPLLSTIPRPPDAGEYDPERTGNPIFSFCWSERPWVGPGTGAMEKLWAPTSLELPIFWPFSTPKNLRDTTLSILTNRLREARKKGHKIRV